MDIPDNDGRTPFSWAAANGHIAMISRLIELSAHRNTPDHDGKTPAIGADENDHKGVVNTLDELHGNRNTPDNPGSIPVIGNARTLLSWIAEVDNWDTVVDLLRKGANIKDLSLEECELLKKHLEKSDYEDTPQLLTLIKERLSILPIEHLVEFRALSESVGLEGVEENPSPGCSHWPRRRRDLAACMDGDERDRPLFPYEPLQEYGSVEQRQAARVYSQIAAAIAWQQGESLDNLLRYQRNLGDILDEGRLNQSPREQLLLENHYQQAQQFFQNTPKTTLLEIPPEGFEPLVGHSMLFESGQQSLVVFNDLATL